MDKVPTVLNTTPAPVDETSPEVPCGANLSMVPMLPRVMSRTRLSRSTNCLSDMQPGSGCQVRGLAHFDPFFMSFMLSVGIALHVQALSSPRGDLCSPSPSDVMCTLSPVALDLPVGCAIVSPQLEDLHQDGGPPEQNVPTSQEFYLGEFSTAVPSMTFDDIVSDCGLSEGKFLTVIVVSLPLLLLSYKRELKYVRGRCPAATINCRWSCVIEEA